MRAYSIKKNRIPRLRFNTFNKNWNEAKIGDYYKGLRTGMTPYRGIKEYYTGEILWITSGELNYNLIDNTNEKITQKAVNDTNLKLYPKNTFFIAITGLEAPGTRGRCAINSKRATTNQSCLAFEEIQEIDNKFLFYWYNRFGEELYFRFAQGSKQQSYNNKIIEKISIIFPSSLEQQKIASFLTTVDDKIELLKKKKSLLEQYKKGIMQKIFNQELRFKPRREDYPTDIVIDLAANYPDWEEKKLGEVCEIIMGQSPSSNSYNTKQEGIPLIQGNADILNRVSKPRNWTTEKTKECRINDLILTVRAPVGAIAKSIHNACIGRGVCAIRSKAITNLEFVYQFLLDYETKWRSLEQGSTFTAVSGVEIRKLKINIPCLDEQTKIANFLSVIDKKIELVKTQLENTQQFKKGLLQQMFV